MSFQIRTVDDAINLLVKIIAIAMSVFHLYTAIFGLLESWKYRAVHIIFILLIATLMGKGIKIKTKWPIQLAQLAIVIGLSLYMILGYNGIIHREGSPNLNDIIAGAILILLVLDLSRRYVGFSMFTIASVFLVYATYGYLLPGRLAAPKFTFDRIIGQMFNSTSGILGSTAGVAATSVVIFIIFGAFLEASGGTEFFSDIALLATRRVTGGPAKASVISSALVGSIQGNAVSNVVTTGTFTIPLMIKSGYSPVYAGAVEAVASTGGMIMPPVMGAAAFILAEISRTPYSDVLIYAIVPALLYYLGVFVMVHLNAKKNKIENYQKELIIEKSKLFWSALTSTVPIVTLVYLLMSGKSPMRSATIATGALVLIWIIRPINRMKFSEFLTALEKGATNMITVSAACIVAGIVIGSVSLTGLATKIAVLVSMAGTNVWLVLFLCMVVAIIFGMGLPVSASYVIAAITLGGLFPKFGIEMVQGHFFLLYYATLSAITPPVALASYAAAGIAKVSSNKIGYQAVKLALPGFIIPYIFVFNKELLLMGETWKIVGACVSAALAVISLSIAFEGWLWEKIGIMHRIAFAIASVFLMIVGRKTDLIGLAILISAAIFAWLISKKNSKEREGNVSENI